MKQKTIFTCQECGYSSPKWVGRCPDCENWNTLVEERVVKKSKATPSRRGISNQEKNLPQSIAEIKASEQERLKSGIEEFDRVLGGGAVPGSVALIGGDPGIGKSTILLQACDKLSQKYGIILYVTGEESANQTKLRANRIGIKSKELYILCETDISVIENHVERLSPAAVVVDSIQTVYHPEIQSTPGNVSQVRESTATLTYIAKSKAIPIFIIGHMTKEGTIAGPRVMEHMVDTVLYFEGDTYHIYRILRAVKNRFGSTNEIGVFEMRDTGLKEITNPSEMLLSERQEDVSGSVVISVMEGTRPILLELQALVAPANFGVPQRTPNGVERNRLALLLAVLDKRAGLRIQNSDVFVNVVGGIQASEPGVDLGILAAVASSFKNISIDPKTVVVGEVGLGGEVRAVHQADNRIGEAAKLGFTRAIVSQYNLRGLKKEANIEVLGVRTVNDALNILL
ncbi:DNA repair protein RadA [Candidatus Poribacteria bacterium]|nr:DNA repair protein RadA [Candidatus Poribacteria bacterium]